MNKEKNPTTAIMLSFIEIGFRISIPLVVLVLAGNWADLKWGTRPLFLLLGILLSLGTSGYGIYQAIKKITTKER